MSAKLIDQAPQRKYKYTNTVAQKRWDRASIVRPIQKLKKKVPKKWQSERETEIDYGLSDWTNMFKYGYGNQSNSINENAFII